MPDDVLELVETPSGFAFDALLVIRQTIYDLDRRAFGSSPAAPRPRARGPLRGLRAEEHGPPDRDSNASSRCRRRTRRHGYAEFVRLRAEGDRMVLDGTTVGYADFFASGGRYKPGVSDTESVFSVVGGKLRVDETEHNFYVDPESMARTPTGDPIKLVGEQVN